MPNTLKETNGEHFKNSLRTSQELFKQILRTCQALFNHELFHNLTVYKKSTNA
jgi:hypothetical protein